jgi:hypothetical protein
MYLDGLANQTASDSYIFLHLEWLDVSGSHIFVEVEDASIAKLRWRLT